jgi:formate dehydrogenase iron-sulfur subunit
VDLVALAEDVREQIPGGAELDALGRWNFMSDVCKHCVEAPCQQACPTGAIICNEFDNVFIQPDVCCGYCVAACPYGVITRVPHDGRAFKCTLCYDRQKDGLEPACAKACPTNSIQFGVVEELEKIAEQRVAELHRKGYTNAFVYGTPEVGGTGSINGNHSKFIWPSLMRLRRRYSARVSRLSKGLCQYSGCRQLMSYTLATELRRTHPSTSFGE